MSGGWVVWLTGLPASGKSTLAAEVARRLRRLGRPVAVLDSDEVRAALFEGLGYGPKARDRFYAALAALAALLARQGLYVLVPATAHRRSYRQRARRLAPRFLEIFIDASPAQCESRDVKGLYARARAGKARGLPGVDVPFEIPRRADLVAQGGRDRHAAEAITALLAAGATGRMAR